MTQEEEIIIVPKLTLNQLVSNLSLTQRLKTVGLFYESIQFDRQYLDELIDAKKDENPTFAGEIYERLGETELALDLYQLAYDTLKEGYNRWSGNSSCVDSKVEKLLDLAKKINDPEEVLLWRTELINLYVGENGHPCKDLEKALKIIEREECFQEKIPEIKEEISNEGFRKVRQYKRDGQIHEALDLAEKHGFHEEVIGLFSDFYGKNHLDGKRRIGEYLEAQGFTERAFEFYKEGENYESAIRIAQSLGRDLEVKPLVRQWIKTKIQKKHDLAGAKIAEMYGLSQQAIDLYVDSGRHFDALRISRNAGLEERFQEVYDVAINSLKGEGLAQIQFEFGNEEDKSLGITSYLGILEATINHGLSSCGCCYPKLEDAAKIATKLGLQDKADGLLALYAHFDKTYHSRN
ncbi:hypothetical protein HQ489_05275 [Candidatus Woesearchaeota archaeon]|nr:hypothetical protein [Candidatus Woesearchaeota archaeon]